MKPADRELKKTWKELERQKAQAALPLATRLLESLFASVAAQLEVERCDHTYRFTDQWLSQHQQPRAKVLKWLGNHGGFCDCEVVANARDHWEQNK